MTDQNVDLRVRAIIEGKKDLEGVAKSIAEISAAIDKQSAAAKSGQKVFDELKASEAALAIEAAKLKSTLGELNTFQAYTKKVTDAEKSVDKATKAHTKFREELEKQGNVTDTQQARLAKLAASEEAATARLAKRRAEQTSLNASLSAAGLVASDYAESQQRITEAMLTQAQVQAKINNELRNYAANVASGRAAEKTAADERNAALTEHRNKLSVINAQVAKSNKLAADAAAAQAKVAAEQAAFGKLADEAQKSAVAFTTLANASSNLRPNVVSLREAINGIVNPGQTLRKTLSGVEQEVNGLATTVSKIKGPVTEYRTVLASLEAAQKTIGKQSGLVDDFRRQTDALRAARSEFTQARAQVLQYAAAVRQGGSDAQGFVKALADAQARTRAAAEALNAQVAATRASRDALRQAGISTNDLAGAQERLKASARTTVTTTEALTAAVKQYGMAQEQVNRATRSGAGGTGLFGDEGRTTLSFFQRLRGEVLSLAAAYVGLYGVINTAKGALDAFSAREGAKNQLAISVGNNRESIDAEYNYVKAQSDRIGVEFERAIKGYAKFSAAATLAGRSRQEVRAVFESFTEVARVANLSADDLDGVFKALEQIYSKGTIQAEELRGQLGDRLFGAFEIAAKALKDQFPDIEKAMKNGLVTSDQLVKIAEKYREIVASQLPAAQRSLAAEQSRTTNAVLDFKLAVADSGWVDAYKRALVVIVDFLRSAEGENAAKQFGNALVAIANAFIVVARNGQYLEPILYGLIGLMTFKVLNASISLLGVFAANLALIAPAAGKATGAVIAFTSSLGAMSAFALGALGGVIAAFAGWQLGSVLYEKSDAVRKFGIFLVTGFAEIFSIVKHTYEAAFEALPLVAKNAFAAVLNTITLAARKMLGVFAVLSSAVGLDDVAAVMLKAVNQLTVGYQDVGAVITKQRAKLEADLQRIRDIRYDMGQASEQQARATTTAPATLQTRSGQGATQTPFPTVTGSGRKTTGTSEAEVKKLETLKSQIESALNAIDTKIDRSQTESLQAQIDAVDSQYKDLKTRIEKLGGETGRAYMTRLNEAIDALKGNIRDKFNKGLEDDFKALTAELANVSAAAGRKDKLDLKSRQDAIVDSYTGLYQKLADLRAKFEANGMSTAQADASKASLDGYVAQLQKAEELKVEKEELNRREERLNELLKLREAQIAAINAQRDAGSISEEAAAARINALNVESLPGITAAGEATRQWAEQNAAIFATPQDKEIFLAQLEAIRAKASQVKTEFTDLQKQAGSLLAGSVDKGLNSVFDNLEKIAQGQQDLGGGFAAVRDSFLEFARDFLRELAIMIIRQQIFNALANSGNPFLASAGVAGGGKVGAPVQHSGGIVGSLGGRTRTVDTAWFANAPRYHQGGVPGLASDEYATILQKGEEVLAADSPRNIMNGGGLTSGGGDAAGTRIVLVDDRAKVPEAMASPDGERVIVQTIKRNLPSIKQMLKA